MFLDGTQDDDFCPSTTLPEKSTTMSFQKGYVLISNVSSKAPDTQMFDDLNHILISLGQLCDDKCAIVLTKKKLIANKIRN